MSKTNTALREMLVTRYNKSISIFKENAYQTCCDRTLDNYLHLDKVTESTKETIANPILAQLFIDALDHLKINHDSLVETMIPNIKQGLTGFADLKDNGSTFSPLNDESTKPNVISIVTNGFYHVDDMYASYCLGHTKPINNLHEAKFFRNSSIHDYNGKLNFVSLWTPFMKIREWFRKNDKDQRFDFFFDGTGFYHLEQAYIGMSHLLVHDAFNQLTDDWNNDLMPTPAYVFFGEHSEPFHLVYIYE